jgi:hypothetical protein
MRASLRAARDRRAASGQRAREAQRSTANIDENEPRRRSPEASSCAADAVVRRRFGDDSDLARSGRGAGALSRLTGRAEDQQ